LVVFRRKISVNDAEVVRLDLGGDKLDGTLL
jgi:hypothetical protein